ncbi:MAG: NADH-quinone oxidoreductase subunit A [Candidatus Hodarchaeota archaeon]
MNTIHEGNGDKMQTPALPELAIIGIFISTIIFSAILVLVLSYFVSPRNPSPRKAMPFESGQIPKGKGRTRLFMQYYPYLLMFLLFDLTSMFLYAWALTLEILPSGSILFVVLFLVILAFPLIMALYLSRRRELW